MTELGRNDVCSCGSGKKYKKCCLLKDKEEDKDLDADLYVTPSKTPMRTIYGSYSHDERHRNEFKNIVSKKLVQPMYYEDGINLLNDIKMLFTSYIQQYKHEISCTKGCSVCSCCCIAVDTTRIEAEYIRKYLKTNFSQDQLMELHTKIIEVVKEYPNKYLPTSTYRNKKLDKEFFYKQIACPFLSENKECVIYTVRPYNCIHMNVFSDTIDCKVENYKPLNFGTLLDTSISAAINFININVYRKVEYNFLPHWFIDGFDELSSDRCVDMTNTMNMAMQQMKQMKQMKHK
jgi:hypothetical protein